MILLDEKRMIDAEQQRETLLSVAAGFSGGEKRLEQLEDEAFGEVEANFSSLASIYGALGCRVNQS